MQVLIVPCSNVCFIGNGYVMQDHRPSVVPFDNFVQNKVTLGLFKVEKTQVLVSDLEFQLAWEKDPKAAVENIAVEETEVETKTATASATATK